MSNVTLGRSFNPNRAIRKSYARVKNKMMQAKIEQAKMLKEAEAKANREIPVPSGGVVPPKPRVIKTPQVHQTQSTTTKSESGLSKLIVPGAIAIGALMLMKG